jgi:hypothetical protein
MREPSRQYDVRTLTLQPTQYSSWYVLPTSFPVLEVMVLGLLSTPLAPVWSVRSCSAADEAVQQARSTRFDPK